MARGVIRVFEKDSGFIAPDDGSPEVFLHISAVERAGLSVRPGDAVTYDKQYDRMRDRMFAINLAAA